jgi:hypothetical protein
MSQSVANGHGIGMKGDLLDIFKFSSCLIGKYILGCENRNATFSKLNFESNLAMIFMRTSYAVHNIDVYFPSSCFCRIVKDVLCVTI